MAKTNWPSNALLDLIGTELPIIQAPMAGAQGAELAIAVAQAGGLGSLACAILSASDIEEADQQSHEAAFGLTFFAQEKHVVFG